MTAQKKGAGCEPTPQRTATTMVSPRPARAKCLIVCHGNRWMEVYGAEHLDIRIVQAPMVTTPAAEIATEDYVSAILPWWARELYWPCHLRATACLHPWTPADMMQREVWRLAHHVADTLQEATTTARRATA